MNRVVLTENDGVFSRWANQYADVAEDRFVVTIPARDNLTIADVIRKIREAANLAGRGGYLIFSVGHGGSDSVSNGMVDLAPNGLIRIDNDVFTNPNNQRRRPFYTIRSIFREARIGRVILLTCRVGNAIDFVQRLANEWQVTVRAYTRRVVGIIDDADFARVYLQGDAPGEGSNTERARTQLPYTDSDYHTAYANRRRSVVPPAMYKGLTHSGPIKRPPGTIGLETEI